MRSNWILASLVSVCVVSIAGCGSGSNSASPTSPSPSPAPAPALSLAGTWTGTITSPEKSIPVRSWTAAQSGASASGPMVIDGGGGNANATLTGTVAGAQLTAATFTVPAQSGGLPPGCSFSGTGTLAATASSISGGLAMTFPPACVGPDNVSRTATATWTFSLAK